MKIQDNVAHRLLPVEGQLEGQIVGFDYEPFLQLAGRLEDLGVIGESWRPNEHMGQLLEDAVVRVVLHFEEGGTDTRFGLLGLGLLGLGVLHCHLHSNNDNQCIETIGCYCQWGKNSPVSASTSPAITNTGISVRGVSLRRRGVLRSGLELDQSAHHLSPSGLALHL